MRAGLGAASLALLLAAEAGAVTAHAFESGVASWYGEEFAGRPTASGETFDPEGLTAAHRTLPFGTLLLVTNVDNGCRAQVRVNDRGPFVHGRILDCASGAARVLGFLRAGTARVEIEILGQLPSASDSRLKPNQRKRLDKALRRARKERREVDLAGVGDVLLAVDPSRGPFAVQVGAFANPDNARRLVGSLEDAGFPAGIVRMPQDELWRVRVGPLPERGAADDTERRLAALGHPTFVVRAD